MMHKEKIYWYANQGESFMEFTQKVNKRIQEIIREKSREGKVIVDDIEISTGLVRPDKPTPSTLIIYYHIKRW